VPQKPEDVPQYAAQLALYQRVLAQLYPGRDVRAALVWTSGPALMALSPAALAAALAAVSPLRETA
jgi:ATP-dependent helicase/nuclease subunit A